MNKQILFKFSFLLLIFLLNQMDYRIKETLARIEKNISKPLKPCDLAESLNLSVSHFQHLFKKEVNVSVIKYINSLRLQKARELLETSYLRVKEIKLKVGITNNSHFLGDFKREFGETPNGYRKTFRNSRNSVKIAGMDNK